MARSSMVVLASLAAVSLVVAGCSSTAVPAPRVADASGQSLEVELGTFFFKADPIVLKAGDRVTLKLDNKSAIEHEFMAGRTSVASGGYAEDLFKDVKVEVVGDKTVGDHGASFGVLVAAGKTAQLRFTVPVAQGTYEIGCFLPGHYQAGMKGKLVIE